MTQKLNRVSSVPAALRLNQVCEELKQKGGSQLSEKSEQSVSKDVRLVRIDKPQSARNPRRLSDEKSQRDIQSSEIHKRTKALQDALSENQSEQ